MNVINPLGRELGSQSVTPCGCQCSNWDAYTVHVVRMVVQHVAVSAMAVGISLWAITTVPTMLVVHLLKMPLCTD